MNRTSGLRTLLLVMGLVMVVTGLDSVVRGTGSILGAGPASTNVDNELRFYAAWYVGAGVLTLRASRHVERETFIVRWVGAVFFLGACARALGWIVEGRPHDGQIVLMVIEFVIPAVVIPWQAAVARRP